jgi:hypothetical protein
MKEYRIIKVQRPTLSVALTSNKIQFVERYIVQQRRRWLYLWLPWKTVTGDFTEFEFADFYIDQQIDFEAAPIQILHTVRFRSYR